MNLPKKLPEELPEEVLEEDNGRPAVIGRYFVRRFDCDENRFCFGLAVGKYGTGYIRVR